MLVGCAVVLNVVEHLVRDLEDGLIHDILVGPRAGLSAKERSRSTSKKMQSINILDTKLNALEPLRQLVHHLLLDGAMRPSAAHFGGWMFGFRGFRSREGLCVVHASVRRTATACRGSCGQEVCWRRVARRRMMRVLGGDSW